MPTKKWLKPYAKKTEATKDVRSRLSIVEEICMLTAPKWNGSKMVRWMTILEACNKVWISDMTFRNWRQEDKKIHDYYESTKKARKEMAHSSMRDYAMNNVFNVLSWQVKLRQKELVDVSLRYLEKTDESFNQSIKVDVEDKTNPMLSMSREELTQRIMELASTLNINNIQNEWIWNQYPSITTTNEKQTGCTEGSWTNEGIWDGGDGYGEWA